MTTKQYYLLTGDIGGTNSRMALYDTNTSICNSRGIAIYEKKYRNAEHILPESYNDPNVFINQIIIPFLQYCFDDDEMQKKKKKKDVQIIATFAVAGLVVNNSVHLTNLGNIIIDGNAIENNHMNNIYLQKIIICNIINDFVAQGYGCLTLQQHEVRTLYGPYQNVNELPIGPKVCIGAGTGLGECYLTPNNPSLSNDTGNTPPTAKVTYSCYASEGGHVEYAPRNNDIEIQMYQYLMKKFDSKERISVERVVSGIGLANVYEFLSTTFTSRINHKVHDEFRNAGDEQGRVVSQNINICTLCRDAMSIMMSAYGCETGNVAIKFIPIGGLFVTGGLTPKNIQHIEGIQSDFMKSYLNKGRVSKILDQIPLFAVMVEDLGVRGAHKAAYTEYENHIQRITNDEDHRRGNYYEQKRLYIDRWLQFGTIVTALTFAVVGTTITLLRSRK